MNREVSLAMKSAIRPLLLAAGVSTCLSVLAPSVALAQSEAERANARAAATAGAEAYEAKDYQKTVDYFERAESLVHSPVHLWYIARGAKELGQLVKAKESCLRVRREGIPQGASRGIVAAAEGCESILTELHGRIPNLTIEVTGAEPGKPYKVLRNGEEVPAAIIGIPVPVDPGEYTLTAEGAGYTALPVEISVAEGTREVVTIALAPAAGPAATTGAEDAPARQAEPGETQRTGPEDRAGLTAPPWPSYLAWGVGLGGIGAGIAFGKISLDAANQRDELCPPNADGDRICSFGENSNQANLVNSLNEDAGTFQVAAIIGYGVGGAAIATGFVLWIVDMNKQKKSAGLQPSAEPWVRPVIGFDHIGVAGTF